MTISELEGRFLDRVPGIMGVRTHYAVLVPVVEWNGTLHLLFEVRSDALRRQPGEVCFPGGRMEEGETPTQCALRETCEELAIPPSSIRPMARLDDVFMPTHGLMHPVLAQVDAGADILGQAHLGNIIQIVFQQGLLEAFFAGGVDALADDPHAADGAGGDRRTHKGCGTIGPPGRFPTL